ncbi:hypothetical protein B0H11DRAFT_798075 [Mycena galericulata]|nr:hypothetical protein B0H11DRAFT_798075 [Mycena galericulata]
MFWVPCTSVPTLLGTRFPHPPLPDRFTCDSSRSRISVIMYRSFQNDTYNECCVLKFQLDLLQRHLSVFCMQPGNQKLALSFPSCSSSLRAFPGSLSRCACRVGFTRPLLQCGFGVAPDLRDGPGTFTLYRQQMLVVHVARRRNYSTMGSGDTLPSRHPGKLVFPPSVNAYTYRQVGSPFAKHRHFPTCMHPTWSWPPASSDFATPQLSLLLLVYNHNEYRYRPKRHS